MVNFNLYDCCNRLLTIIKFKSDDEDYIEKLNIQFDKLQILIKKENDK